MRLALSVLALCFSLLTLPARAETRAGVILGGNVASQTISSNLATGTSGSRAGFLLGGFAQWRITREFHAETQVRFVKKGGKELPYQYQNQVGNIGMVDYSLTYLEIPAYAKWRFWTNHPLRPFVFAGPALAFKVGGSSEQRGNAAFYPQVNGDASELKGVDFSFDFGAGADLKLTKALTVSLALAYSLGLPNITGATVNNGFGLAAGEYRLKNRGLQIYAGAGWPI